ncbi:MAG: FAD-dependent oxidoreductase [Lachnospiraceae bacterium]|nr:FAD-dependent oxidoreductase [Lachnospiraceae bacterium]
MKKSFRSLLALGLVLGMAGCSTAKPAGTTTAAPAETTAAAAGKFTPGTYTGTGKGNNGDVTVEVVLSADAITDVVVKEHAETPGLSDPALENIPQEIISAQTVNVDAVSGATNTSNAIIEAVKNALESAGVDLSTLAAAGTTKKENVPVTYTAGTYTGKGTGYNGEVLLDVTFGPDGITDIQVNKSAETNYVGTPAYDIMFADAKEANGSGVDSVSGATFTSIAVKAALNDAAEQAKASDLDGFKSNTVVHEAGEAIDETYDVVVVGGGGAGMGAAAEAAQNGLSVVVLEKNAEIGGNTVVSGGAFQSVMPYLVWDPADPDAAAAVWSYNNQTYDKVMSTQGCIDVLKTIANWSEEPFDEEYYKTHEYVAGEIDDLSQHGVHAEYLPTLQALKSEIKAYLDWAQPKLDAGTPENEITLFSTVNLHIFQTYYGGLRSNSDKTEWIYGDFDLVSQFIEDGQGLKEWLEDQGALFDDASQPTLIGALWYRENQFGGGDLDGDGKAEVPAQWGTYFETTKNTLLNTSETASQNKIMVRTNAENLIVEDGRVTGVTATQYDGTQVTVHAAKGVVLATGGYAANIEKVAETNKYWDKKFITEQTKTTNRSSLQGDGTTMAEAVGGTTTGEGWTQMMPISWIDNGNLAFGAGTYAVYMNPTTGTRFVNESAERDVLSLGEFNNGIEVNGTQGVFLEISNADVMVGRPYPYDDYTNNVSGKEDVDGRVYFVSSQDELQKVLDEYGMEADPATIYSNIEAYDKAIMAGEQPADVHKSQASNIIGNAEKDSKDNYDAGTYTLDGVKLRVRIMAPSTHHTMGGVTVDTDRHVLDADSKSITGLYAAGEVTGGIHGGNRLGGNAIVEIFVSGRTAAQAIIADNK